MAVAVPSSSRAAYRAAVPAGPVARRVLLAVLLLAGAGLLRWAHHLGQVLPDEHVTDHWRAAWVGLDLAIAGCLLAAGWLARQRRLVAVRFCVAAATLLLCDAWFDVLLDWDSPDRWKSVALAAVVEVPAAVALLLAGRPLVAGGVPTVRVDPVHVAAVYADPDCRRMLQALGEEGPAETQLLAAVAGLPPTLAADVLERMRAAGEARRRWDGRWERTARDLRWPDPDSVAWRRSVDRAAYEAFLDAKYEREVEIMLRAIGRRTTFGRWATGSRSSAYLTADELAAFEREYLDLLLRHAERRRRPEPGTRHLALRFYAFPHDVVDEVDAELHGPLGREPEVRDA